MKVNASRQKPLAPVKPEREAAMQSTAEFIYTHLRALKTPTEATTSLGMVHCAFLMMKGPRTEEELRELLGFYANGVVELWKVQMAAQSDPKGSA